MAWQTIRVANPTRRRRHAAPSYEGLYYPHTGIFERKKGRRFWDVEGVGGVSPAKARKSVARHKRKKAKKSWLNPSRRNQNILTDAVAGSIASKVADKVAGMFTKHSTTKRRKTVKRKRTRNSSGYFWSAAKPRGEKYTKSTDIWGKPIRKRRKKTVRRKTRRKNPHLALIGANPRRTKTMTKARRRRKRNSLRGRPRDSKGRLLKIRNTRRRRKASTISRRRRNIRVAPRRRRRNRTRVVTKIKWRTRRINVARRKRKSTRRRSRRRNTALAALAANPRRRRRGSRRRVHARRRRNYSRRRRNAGLGGLIGRVNLMQVAEVAGGVFLGDKVTSYLGNQVNSMIGITDPTTGGLVKAGLGIVTAGFVWRFRPALGLGIAVGAANSLLNQYVFTPLWGYASPYLPTGMAGLGEYVDRTWKADNWLAAGGAPGALAGMGANSLNRSSL